MRTIVSYSTNDSELPEFLSFDVRADYTVDVGSHNFSAYVSLSNIGRRKNIGALDYEVDGTPGTGLVFTPEDEELFELIPNIGLAWTVDFK